MNQMSGDLHPLMGRRAYGALQLSADKKVWKIVDPEPHICIRLKQIFPRIPKYAPGPFTLLRDDVVDRDLRWFLELYPLRMSAEDLHDLELGQQSFLDKQAEMERILLPTYTPPYGQPTGLKPGQVVRPYQSQANDYAHRSKGLLLVDPCGSGKTYTGAAFCLEHDHLPAAVVCTVQIQKQWMEKIESFTNLRVHLVKKASMYDLPPADVYIFRYSQLAGWTNIFARGFFKTVIYDEPQDLRRGQDSEKGKAARILSDNTEWRMGLTATPIMGFGAEIYQVMSFINSNVLGSEEDFVREWCSSDNKSGKRILKDPKALGSFLRDSHVFLRRTKAEIGNQMPPINRFVEMVAYDQAAVKSIEDLASALAIKATTGSFVERGMAARELDIMVRQATGVAKAHYVAQYVRMLIESGEPVILFGWHRAVYDIWIKELKDLNPRLYTGSESPNQKSRAMEDFLNGRTDLLIMSLRSAPGIDGLQNRCSTVVFGELDWSPGVHHQCIERVDREGQVNFPVNAIFLVTDAGSDQPLMELLGLKASEARQVINPDEELAEVTADHSHLRMIAERYLSLRKHADLPRVDATPHVSTQTELALG